MKKVLCIFIVLLGLTFLFSCDNILPAEQTNPNKGVTYSITYVVDGKIANLAPASYVAGQITMLGNVDNGYTGWYTNPSYTGATYNSISESEYGDKTYYAKPNGYTPLDPVEASLADAIKMMTSYTYELKYEDDDVEPYTYTDTFKYYNGILKYISVGELDTYEDYYFFDKTKNMMCVYLDTSEGYEVYYEDDEFYPLATLYLCDVDFDSINEANYVKNGNTFTAKEDKLLEEELGLFYQLEIENPTSLVIEISEVGVSKITLNFDVDNLTGAYSATYTVTFSNIGSTKVELPEIKDDPTPAETDLGKAVLEMTSYDYSSAYYDEDPVYNNFDDFSYYNGIIRYEYEYDEDIYVDFYYYDYDQGCYVYLYDVGNGEYTAILDDDEFFEYYVMYIVEFDLSAIDEANYTYVDGKYVCNQDALEEEVYYVFYAYEFKEVTSLEITLGTKGIASLVLEFNDEYEGEEYTGRYEIEFSNVGNVNFDLPDTVIVGENAISDVYEYSDGAQVTVQGIVCGTVGNNFYLTDSVSGVYIYYGNTTHNYEVGDYICLTGVKDTYKGLVELKNITAESYVDTVTHKVNPVVLNNFLDVEDYLAMNVSIDDVCLIELPSSFDASSKSDLSFDIKSPDGDTILLFISKHISSSVKQEWYEILSDCEEGDFINIENAVISCFNDYQIAFTEQTEISVGYKEGDPVVLKAVELNTKTITVLEGTSLDDALKDLVVTLKYNDRTTAVATKDDYEVIPVEYNKDKAGTYFVNIKCEDISTLIEINVTASPKEMFKADNTKVELLDDVATLYELTYGIQGTGEGKALIIPIDFTDYPAPDGLKDNLNKAFFGTSEETGWESLASYYYKSSYGKLSISGLVTDVYHTGKSSTYYTNLYDSNYGDPLEYEFIASALAYFDSSIDYSEFDANNDGYIDAIYLIYTCPVDYDSEDSFWWAYTYEYFTEDYEYYDGVEADYYFFAGYEFIYEELMNEKTIAINSETFVHETGHILGLTDYYDYYEGEGPEGGLGGGDMMDYNVGDHNAFSKAILGWVEPYIVTGLDATVTLNSFASSGDCIIIAKNWNDSYFGEYYIIDFYTPDGLNALEAGDTGLFSNAGIRIMHVDATISLDNIEMYYSIWDMYEYDNSSTDHKLIDLVQADKSGSINKDNTYSSNEDLFYAGDVFDWATWYNGVDCGFTLTVKSISNGVAEIVIDFE